MEDFSKMMAEMAAAAAKLRKELEEKEIALKKKEEALNAHSAKFKAMTEAIEGGKGASDGTTIVELNVGGTYFSTLKATLLQYENSYWTVLFSGRYHILKDRDGRIFIDRPPQPFAVLLNWMRRGGHLTKEELKGVDKEALLLEVEYFGLSDAWGAMAPPKPRTLHRVTRCTAAPSSGWGYSGTPDRLMVSSSADILLWGIGIFAVADTKATITITEENATVPLLALPQLTYAGRKNQNQEEEGGTPMLPPSDAPTNVWDIVFPDSVKLEANKKYILSAKVEGGSSSYYEGATPSVKSKDVTFTFTGTSGDNNSTSPTRGQLPCLLWLPVPKEEPKPAAAAGAAATPAAAATTPATAVD